MQVKGFTMGSLDIGEVADRAGVNATAIRYWERQQVLPAPRRVGGKRRCTGCGACSPTASGVAA